jgi:hypothetical protein
MLAMILSVPPQRARNGCQVCKICKMLVVQILQILQT